MKRNRVGRLSLRKMEKALIPKPQSPVRNLLDVDLTLNDFDAGIELDVKLLRRNLQVPLKAA